MLGGRGWRALREKKCGNLHTMSLGARGLRFIRFPIELILNIQQVIILKLTAEVDQS